MPHSHPTNPLPILTTSAYFLPFPPLSHFPSSMNSYHMHLCYMVLDELPRPRPGGGMKTMSRFSMYGLPRDVAIRALHSFPSAGGSRRAYAAPCLTHTPLPARPMPAGKRGGQATRQTASHSDSGGDGCMYMRRGRGPGLTDTTVTPCAAQHIRQLAAGRSGQQRTSPTAAAAGAGPGLENHSPSLSESRGASAEAARNVVDGVGLGAAVWYSLAPIVS
ncbi:hypothetical protein BT67DRAFT_79569 [Trichocladium antarcticum]|uniref:Uncharacterized protein n=1 Tax=Trichocladium antarcticum TaxID=1450529 RepID=A0AAN6UH20_9PEZI|nr:hypothetical protein BT67DRAFT_79569 [Trichocladium antarcticum]